MVLRSGRRGGRAGPPPRSQWVAAGVSGRDSPPKRRGVLTVFGWAPEAISQWMSEGLPLMAGGIDLFPSERGTLIGGSSLNARGLKYVSSPSPRPTVARISASGLPDSGG